MTFRPDELRGFHGRWSKGGGGKGKKAAESLHDGSPSAFAHLPEDKRGPASPSKYVPTKVTKGRAPRAKPLTAREMFGESAWGGGHSTAKPAAKAPAKAVAKKAPAKKVTQRDLTMQEHRDMWSQYADKNPDAHKTAPAKSTALPPLPKGRGFRPSKKAAQYNLLGQYTSSAFDGGAGQKPVGSSTTEQLRGQRAAIGASVGKKPRKRAGG